MYRNEQRWNRWQQFFWILVIPASAGLLSSGCGGSSNAVPPLSVPAQISVSVSPAGTQSVDQGQSKVFTATVTNDASNKGVSWNLTQNGSACSPGCGSISPAATASGGSTTYTAPAAVPASIQVNVTATAVADSSKSASDSISAVQPPTSNNPAQLPAATVGQPYSYTLTESGGVPPFTWSVTSGALPAGLTLNSAGVISGTPASATAVRGVSGALIPETSGSQICFTVKVLDSGNPPLVNSQQICIPVSAGPGNPVPVLVSLTPATAPIGGGPLLLDIFGGSFVAGATVAFGADTLTPSTITSGDVIVTVPAADLAAAGSIVVTVTNPGPGGGISNPLTFTVANPEVAVTISAEPSCSTLGVPFNGTCFVFANVANDPKVLGVTWSLSGAACTGGACGTILAGGGHPFDDRNPFAFYAMYFGPDDPSNIPPTVKVTATSIADPTKSNSTTLSLTAISPTIGIVSPLLTANAGGTTGASGDSFDPAINFDGGYVAFTSAAKDLGFAITQSKQVFWKATCVGQPSPCVPLGTVMVAFNGGAEGNLPSQSPSLSDDGQVVGFISQATNLDPTITQPIIGENAFAATECGSGHCVTPPPHMISVDNLGKPSQAGLGSISPNGRWMVFTGGPEVLDVTATSAGTQFPAGVYIGDTCSNTAAPPCTFGTKSYVSVDNSGNPDNSGGGFPLPGQIVSPTGTGVLVFSSDATNLVPGVTGGQPEIYERDLGLQQTFLVSQDNSGNPVPGPGGAELVGVSEDGRFIAFFAVGLDPTDTSGRAHLYVRDTCRLAQSCSPATTLVDISTVGPNAGKPSLEVFVQPGGRVMSADGRYVAFISDDGEFTTHTDPVNGEHLAVLVKDMSCKAISDCPNGGVHLVSITSSGTSIVPSENGMAISGDGKYVVFTSFGNGHGQLLLALTGF